MHACTCPHLFLHLDSPRLILFALLLTRIIRRALIALPQPIPKLALSLRPSKHARLWRPPVRVTTAAPLPLPAAAALIRRTHALARSIFVAPPLARIACALRLAVLRPALALAAVVIATAPPVPVPAPVPVPIPAPIPIPVPVPVPVPIPVSVPVPIPVTVVAVVDAIVILTVAIVLRAK